MDPRDHDSATLDIVLGGSARFAAPRTTEDRSGLFTAVLGASLLLGCDLVLARHWLPGIHLFIQASHHLRQLDRTSLQGLAAEWMRLEPDVTTWLDRTDGDDHLLVRLSTTFGDCHLARDRAELRFDEVAFTFDLQWQLPPALRA